jgi:hypothetical protein
MSEMYRCKIVSAARVTRPDDVVMEHDEPGDQGANWAEALLGLPTLAVDWHSSWDAYVAWLGVMTQGRTRVSLLAALAEAGWTAELLARWSRAPSEVPWSLREDPERGATPAWFVVSALAGLGHVAPVPALRVEIELVTMHPDASPLLAGLDQWLQLSAFGARLLAEANEGELADSPVVQDLVGEDTYDLWGPGPHEPRADNVVWAAYIREQEPLRFRDAAWLTAHGRQWWTRRTDPVRRHLLTVSAAWVEAIDPARWTRTRLVLLTHPAYLPAPRKQPFVSCACKRA